MKTLLFVMLLMCVGCASSPPEVLVDGKTYDERQVEREEKKRQGIIKSNAAVEVCKELSNAKVIETNTMSVSAFYFCMSEAYRVSYDYIRVKVSQIFKQRGRIYELWEDGEISTYEREMLISQIDRDLK